MNDLTFHPLAEVFPLMEGADFSALVDDIRSNGLREPIITLEDKVLDGRNRLRACTEASIPPRFESYTGTDPVAFVISLNLRRRHLNESQRSIVAARLANMPLGGALYRSANLPTDNRNEIPISMPTVEKPRRAAIADLIVKPGAIETKAEPKSDLSNLFNPAPVLAPTPAPPLVSQVTAADMLNVSDRSDADVRRITENIRLPDWLAA